MNYNKLFQTSAPVKAGLIGTGAFGKSLLFQTQAIAQIQMGVVCDKSIDIARQACLEAGLLPEQLLACKTTRQTLTALETEKVALIEDAALMMDTPLEVVIEATGMPEAGAKHAKLALEHGKHLIIISKEVDCVVGPILSKMAAQRGLVYTQGDGDQPSMLISLISWAETLGLEIICAGKASESDFIYDVATNSIRNRRHSVALERDGLWDLWDIPAGQSQTVIAQRAEALSTLPQVAVPDLCEMSVVINATNYGYDAPRFRAPIARIPELAEVLGQQAAGGIFQSEGVIDMVNCLRRSDEAGFVGGVFVAMACYNNDTWDLLARKGHIINRDKSRAVIFQPYHLLGVQTATSILAAGCLGLPTGASAMKPKIDLIARTTNPLKAGQKLSMIKDHVIPGLEPELAPATTMGPNNPIPFYMVAENRLNVDVPVGALLTYSMVERPANSVLYALKNAQDEAFLE